MSSYRSILDLIYPDPINRFSPQAKGLVGVWPWLEGKGNTGRDVSDKRRNGALTNMENSDWGYNEVGNSQLSFDGVDEHVLITGWKGITGSNARSVSIRFKTTSAGAEQFLSWSALTGQGAGEGFGFSIENGVFWGRFFAGVTFNVGSNLNDGQTHHIIYTYPSGGQNQDANVYIDGVLQNPTFGNGTMVLNTGNAFDVGLGVGNRHAGGGPTYFLGSIEGGAAIYDIELPASVVQHIHDPQTRWDLYREPLRRNYFVPAVAAGGLTRNYYDQLLAA